MQITDLAYIDETGYHFADYPAFLEYEQQQYRAIYGEDVYLEPDSQDGQLLAIRAKANYDLAALAASVFNSFSPVTAQGSGLSRQVKINGIARRVPTYSTVEVEIVGTADTEIINGVVEDTLGQKWNLPASVIIPNDGDIVVTATAQEIGAVFAEANSVNRIFTPTLGWQTVDNAAAATPGQPVETDAELRVRQQLSVANPSLTVLDGTVGAVGNLPGVTKIKGYENDTDSTDGNGLPPHSICIVVAGGEDEAIAQAIQVHKTPGTQTFGDESVTVYDSHGMPIDIHFQRTDPITIKAQITIAANPAWSADYVDLIKEAVANQINSGGIGETILITKLYAPAYLTGTPASQSFDIIALEIAIDGDPLDTANIPLDFDQQAVCDPGADVTVLVT